MVDPQCGAIEGDIVGYLTDNKIKALQDKQKNNTTIPYEHLSPILDMKMEGDAYGYLTDKTMKKYSAL